MFPYKCTFLNILRTDSLFIAYPLNNTDAWHEVVRQFWRQLLHYGISTLGRGSYCTPLQKHSDLSYTQGY